jgi:hypothetical protein
MVLDKKTNLSPLTASARDDQSKINNSTNFPTKTFIFKLLSLFFSMDDFSKNDCECHN